MRTTGIRDLAVPFVLLGAAAYVLLRISYSSIPPLQFSLPLPVAALAAVELVVARRVRSAVRHVADAKPMTALAVARSVALGKASAPVAAGVAGAATALIAHVAPDAGALSAARNDLRIGVALLVAAIALTAAAIVLERAGIDPGSRDR